MIFLDPSPKKVPSSRSYTFCLLLYFAFGGVFAECDLGLTPLYYSLGVGLFTFLGCVSLFLKVNLVATVCMMAASFFLGADRMTLVRQEALVPGHEIRLPSGEPLRIRGVVETFPEFSESKKHFFYELSWQPLNARIQVFQESLPPPKGSLIEIAAILKIPRNFGNSREYSFERHYQVRNILATTFLSKAKTPMILKSPGFFQQKTNEWREKVYVAMRDAMELDNYLTFKSILFGDRLDLEAMKVDQFKKAGILHALVVSGYHVSLIAFLTYSLWVFLFSWAPWMYRYVSSCTLKILALLTSCAFFYVWTNLSIPTERALMFALSYAISLAFKIKWSWKDLLLVWIAVILFLNPVYMFDLSSLLSFGVFAGIMFMGEHSPQVKLSHAWQVAVYEYILVSLAAFVAALPMMTIFFYQIQVQNILGNILFSAWYGPILIPIGLVSSLLLFIQDSIGQMGFLMCDELMTLLQDSLVWFSAKTAFLTIFIETPWWIFSICIAVILVCYGARVRFLTTVGVFLCVYFSLLTAGKFIDVKPSMAEVRMIHVGQGEAIYVRTPSGKSLLIDTGPNSSVILPWLINHGIYALDLLVITHGDMDHIGGALDVVKILNVKELWISSCDHSENTTTFINNLTVDQKIKMKSIPQDLFLWGEENIRLTALNETLNCAAHSNDNSLVLMFDIFKAKLLLTGDISRKNEALLIKKYGADLSADILKVAHHGSRTSTSQLFLDHVNPRGALISAGWNNSFGHPTVDVMYRLIRKNAHFFRTDLDGEIGMKIGVDEITMGRAVDLF